MNRSLKFLKQVLICPSLLCLQIGKKQQQKKIKLYDDLTEQFHYVSHIKRSAWWSFSLDYFTMYPMWTLELLARCHTDAASGQNPSMSAKNLVSIVHIATVYGFCYCPVLSSGYSGPRYPHCCCVKGRVETIAEWDKGKTDYDRGRFLLNLGKKCWKIHRWLTEQPLEKEKTRVCVQLDCTSLHSVAP